MCFDRAGTRLLVVEPEAVSVIDVAARRTTRLPGFVDARAVAGFDDQLWIATRDDAAKLTKVADRCSELIELRKQGKGRTPEYEQKLQQLRDAKAAALKDVDNEVAKIPTWEAGVNEQIRSDLKSRTDRLKSLRDALESLEPQINELAANREPPAGPGSDNAGDDRGTAPTGGDDSGSGGDDDATSDDNTAPPGDAPSED